MRINAIYLYATSCFHYYCKLSCIVLFSILKKKKKKIITSYADTSIIIMIYIIIIHNKH